MAKEVLSHLTHLGPADGRGEREEKEERKVRERESFKERSSTFSLIFPAIRPSVYGGAKGKVHPSCKSFASRPESGSFDKLQEIGVFILLCLVFG